MAQKRKPSPKASTRRSSKKGKKSPYFGLCKFSHQSEHLDHAAFEFWDIEELEKGEHLTSIASKEKLRENSSLDVMKTRNKKQNEDIESKRKGNMNGTKSVEKNKTPKKENRN